MVDRASWRWRAGPVEPGPCVVVDLDGVLADASGRQEILDRPGRRDWDAFFAAAGDDPVLPEVSRVLTLLDPSLAVVLLTARPVSIRDVTLGWLERHQLAWDLLVMRGRRDFRPSPEVKRDELRALVAADFDPRLALEDDQRNVEMFRSEGVTCLYIHSGYSG